MKYSLPKHQTTSYSIFLSESDDRDGTWLAEVPALKIVTEGSGRTGAERAAREAIKGYLEVAKRRRVDVPPGDLIEEIRFIPRQALLDVLQHSLTARPVARKKSVRKSASRKKAARTPSKRR